MFLASFTPSPTLHFLPQPDAQSFITVFSFWCRGCFYLAFVGSHAFCLLVLVSTIIHDLCWCHRSDTHKLLLVDRFSTIRLISPPNLPFSRSPGLIQTIRSNHQSFISHSPAQALSYEICSLFEIFQTKTYLLYMSQWHQNGHNSLAQSVETDAVKLPAPLPSF